MTTPIINKLPSYNHCRWSDNTVQITTLMSGAHLQQGPSQSTYACICPIRQSDESQRCSSDGPEGKKGKKKKIDSLNTIRF